MGQADKYKENKSEGGQQETHAIDRKGKTKIVTFVGIMTYLSNGSIMKLSLQPHSFTWHTIHKSKTFCSLESVE